MSFSLRAPVCLLAALAAGACGAKPLAGMSCPPSSRSATYAADLAPVLNNSCVPCHSSTATNRRGAPVGIDYDTAAAARASGERGLQAISSGRMPPSSQGFSPLSASEGCLYSDWADNQFAP